MEITQSIFKGQILTGPLFNEPMRIETITTNGPNSWVLGLVGTQSERFRRVTLSSIDLNTLNILSSSFNFQGDGLILRLGLQAHSLGIAYEFDPYFGLSISRVDPLPHQLEAVYDYLLKLARVRFLLADDAGAGKTIMAGLLIRELKLRGLIISTRVFSIAGTKTRMVTVITRLRCILFFLPSRTRTSTRLRWGQCLFSTAGFLRRLPSSRKPSRSPTQGSKCEIQLSS